ncbi:hypothetical protein [Intestinibacter bartlettii]|uniref:HNH nuclease domain-containing protein n=1 Tax=Intestinibacter bartlettii TaxID=261299 RepID=A0ABS6E0Y1_9FIRM|nr:hypothetical protein [Intestinibacter bartlettii]MBU5337278.1 hypothetical protein [Intestinibacter bartlettii]
MTSNKNNKKRPPIPNPLKRELRQEAHFGCVNCGNPIIEYHHITPWSEVKEHTKGDTINIKADLYYKGAVIKLNENTMTINNEQCILTLRNTTICDCNCGIYLD